MTPSSKAPLPGTWLYNDIGATPSSPASRRIVRRSAPSRSSSPTAARRILPCVSRRGLG